MDRFRPIEDFRRSYKGAGDSTNIDGLNKNSNMSFGKHKAHQKFEEQTQNVRCLRTAIGCG